MQVLVSAFYCFAPVDEPSALRAELLEQCCARDVRGTILVAPEGVNGTIAGAEDGVRSVVEYIRGLAGFAEMRAKEAAADRVPFQRLKVRLKREIVTFRQPNVDPTARVGTYVTPEEWNALIRREDVTVIDCRNAFEVEHGTFEGSVDPRTRSFSEFAEWVRRDAELDRERPVAMFCTGGIRCEKATSFMIDEGFTEVYHLHGGILRYLDAVPESESLWEGECFVFDERVSVGHDR